MSRIMVREVVSTGDLMAFIKFPWRIYRDDPYWVPPLLFERKIFFNRRKNPFFKHADAALFLAEKNGEAVGTLSAHVDYNFVNAHQEKTGQFGFFECIDDAETAAALFNKGEEFLRGKGMTKALGPFNFTVNHECGLLVDGFDGMPVVMMTYNPPYYEKLITGCGYTKAMDLYAYKMDTKEIPPGLEAFAENFLKEAPAKGIEIRNLNLLHLKREIEFSHKIYNEAWSRNWGAVKMEADEFEFLIHGLKSIIDPSFCFFALKDGEPIGLALSIPDVNPFVRKMNGRLLPFGWRHFLKGRRNFNFIRVIVLGVLHEYHSLGIGGVFYYLTWKEALRKGVKGAEMSWILENNKPMRRALEMMGAQIYRTYRIFGKDL